jgi:hypothetical protein
MLVFGCCCTEVSHPNHFEWIRNVYVSPRAMDLDRATIVVCVPAEDDSSLWIKEHLSMSISLYHFVTPVLRGHGEQIDPVQPG